MDLNQTLRIARSVRKQFEDVAKRECFSQDLCGLCGRASLVLRDQLLAVGTPARLILGTYDERQHCWVQVNDWVIDVTATQFGKKMPKVRIVDYEADKLYESWAEDQDAEEILGMWPYDQQPQEEDAAA